MGNYLKAIKKQDLVEGGGVEVSLEGKSIAVFKIHENIYAIDNLCPHRGGSLAEGDLKGTCVSCPWHAWEFDVTTGCNPENSEIKVSKYNVKIEGEDLWIEI